MKKLKKLTNKEVIEKEYYNFADNEMSIQEKCLLALIVDRSDALKYELVERKSPKDGCVYSFYNIPEEERYNVIKELYPFNINRRDEEKIEDLHCGIEFEFKNAEVIRYKGRNFVVSPYFLTSGGMAVDFIPKCQK